MIFESGIKKAKSTKLILRSRLAKITPDAVGLNSFLLEHYGFSKQTKIELDYEADFFMEVDILSALKRLRFLRLTT